MSLQIQDEKAYSQDSATTSTCANSSFIPRDCLDRPDDISQWVEFNPEANPSLDMCDTRSVDFGILTTGVDSWDKIDNEQYCVDPFDLSCCELDGDCTMSGDLPHWLELDNDWLSSDYDKEWEEEMQLLKNTPCAF
jgi:hypothetical protein